MAKNIIVCSDGTGNTAVKNRGTNVFKIFESTDLNSHRYHPERSAQVAIYDDGVGTETFKPIKLLGGIGGFGLSRNVRQLYKELCRIYDPGDQIFLFGFSRGAFTVRTLCGLIAACGILRVREVPNSRKLERLVVDAYKTYRRRYRTDLMRVFLGPPDQQELERFKSTHCHGNERIAFIGVWDTVDAVGLPLAAADFVNRFIYQFKFPSLTLSSSVDRAYHALSIDDQRQSFLPVLWDEHPKSHAPGQFIEQVWFAGAHSNVGGGYPKQGMSLVALDWIMKHAEDAGLRFVADERAYYREHTNVDDKLYDPRSGLGMFYRWMPRNIGAICRARGSSPAIHMSVLERSAHGTEDYSPGNLPPDAKVVFTETGDRAKDAVARERATKLQKVLQSSGTNGRSLLDGVEREVRIGRASYLVFLLGCVLLPLGLFVHPWSLTLSLCCAASAGLMAAWSKSRRQLRFSAFWFEQQQVLRDELKSTRARPSEAAMRLLPDMAASRVDAE